MTLVIRSELAVTRKTKQRYTFWCERWADQGCVVFHISVLKERETTKIIYKNEFLFGQDLIN